MTTSHATHPTRPVDHPWRTRFLRCCFGLLAVVCLGLGALSWQGCARSCNADTDCDNNLRCGPGKFCIIKCFAGETNACVLGFVCAEDGASCVKGTASGDASTTPDVTNEPSTSEPAPTESTIEKTTDAGSTGG